MQWGCSIHLSKMNRFVLIGVEAAGRGVDTNEHAATMTKGTPWCIPRLDELPAAG